MTDADKKVKKVRLPSHKVEKIARPASAKREHCHKLSVRGALVRDVIRSVAGFAPYEKYVIELLKVGTAASQKRALKFCKKRLGSHARALKKREQLSDAIAAQRKRS